MTEPDGAASPFALLDPDEPPAFETVNTAGPGSVVLVCDHASNRIPRRLGTLGLDADRLAEHIGWDPGAAEVARRLSDHLNAPLVLSGYSRLVIDCNRRPDSVQSIPEQSAGVPVPGNVGLSAEERQQRRRGLFAPYHEAIGRLLDRRAGQPTLLLSIHSFTPALNGRARPWQIGLSPGHDRRLAELMRGALTRDGRLTVGDDQPYPIDRDNDYTIPVHGDGRGLPCVMVEIRQDGLRNEAEAAAWAARLADAYHRVEADALASRGT